jgi:UDP-N-acetylmuramate--alanine ligase
LKSNLLEIPQIRHIHFIGIDGISMSGLAEILLGMGYKISGSDIKTSSKTLKLENMGAKIFPYHSEDNIQDQDLIVYTAAVKENNPEIIKAKKLNIPLVDRATLLGQIMKRYPYSVAVSGTHGKTTTTSMMTTIMLESALNPTVHIGAQLESIGGTTHIGGDKFFIAEACEYCGSFLKFYPYMAVILNIEYDHADYFRSIDHVKDTFKSFADLVPKDGYLVACADDANTMSILEDIKCNKITYSIKSDTAMWSAKNITFDDMGFGRFIVVKNREELGEIRLSIPGMHNVSNSLAAVAACYTLGCDFASIQRGLLKFSGAHQRFELKGIVDNIKVIDDYAHHPSEIKATLKAAKNIRHSRMWCVFQPHTYSRAKFLLDEFARAFTDADNVIVSDIYAARETNNGEIHSSVLAERIKANGQETLYISGFENIVDYLDKNAAPGDIIITMGAGDINKVGEMYLELKKKKTAAVS